MCCCVHGLHPPALVWTCSGPIPKSWQNKTRDDVPSTRLPSFISAIDLSGNQLRGSLPEIIGGINANRFLRDLFLHNMFEGRVGGNIG